MLASNRIYILFFIRKFLTYGVNSYYTCLPQITAQCEQPIDMKMELQENLPWKLEMQAYGPHNWVHRELLALTIVLVKCPLPY